MSGKTMTDYKWDIRAGTKKTKGEACSLCLRTRSEIIRNGDTIKSRSRCNVCVAKDEQKRRDRIKHDRG